MVLFPNCKINLGLNIVRKRADGYHDLETVLYPVGWRDALEVISDHNAANNGIRFTNSGLAIEGDSRNNLCVKAYRLLQNDFPQLPPVQIHLHKTIPMGAGLGGGSADGAFTLKLLNEKFSLGLSSEQLMHYALQLGSDCPFFIVNRPGFATGRGEFIEPVDLDLRAYTFVLINPGIHISTAFAFSQIHPKPPVIPLTDIVCKPIQEWKHLLVNDFEAPACKQYPVIAAIREQLYSNGALYASMTGSGSTLYGIFPAGHHFTAPANDSWSVREIPAV